MLVHENKRIEVDFSSGHYIAIDVTSMGNTLMAALGTDIHGNDIRVILKLEYYEASSIYEALHRLNWPHITKCVEVEDENNKDK